MDKTESVKMSFVIKTVLLKCSVGLPNFSFDAHFSQVFHGSLVEVVENVSRYAKSTASGWQ